MNTIMTLNPSYTTILELAKALRELNMPMSLERLFDGYIIVLYDRTNPNIRVADFIEHYGSYGSEWDLVESMGFSDDYGDVTGHLTIEEALAKVKKDFFKGE